jgi:hypothetical protein
LSFVWYRDFDLEKYGL